MDGTPPPLVPPTGGGRSEVDIDQAAQEVADKRKGKLESKKLNKYPVCSQVVGSAPD